MAKQKTKPRKVPQVLADVVLIPSPPLPNLNPPVPPPRKVPLDDPFIAPKDPANVAQGTGPTPPMYGPPPGSDPQVHQGPLKPQLTVSDPPAPGPQSPPPALVP
jgi:hypothetical protein